jgi:hypothetical protein
MPDGPPFQPPVFHAWPAASLSRAGFNGPWVRVALEGDALVLSGEGAAPLRLPLSGIVGLRASVVSGRQVRHMLRLTLAEATAPFVIASPPPMSDREGYERVVLGLAASLFARGLPVATGHGWFGVVFGLGSLGLLAVAFVAFSIVLAVEEGEAWWHPLPGFAVILAVMALLRRTLLREAPRRALTPDDLARAFAWR